MRSGELWLLSALLELCCDFFNLSIIIFLLLLVTLQILKEVLGDVLFIPTEEQRHPIEFLSPEELKGKIVISDKPYRDLVEEQVGVARPRHHFFQYIMLART